MSALKKRQSRIDGSNIGIIEQSHVLLVYGSALLTGALLKASDKGGNDMFYKALMPVILTKVKDYI